MNTERVPPEQWRQMQNENARQLESAVSDLEHDFPLGFFSQVDRSLRIQDETNFSMLWAQVKQTQELFKTLKPVDRDVQQRLWERFNLFRDKAREAQKAYQERYEDGCRDNYNEIYKGIQDLITRYNLDGISLYTSGSRTDLSGFKDDAAHVQHLLSSLKPLKREQRDDLRNLLNGVWDKVKHIREQKNNDWRQNQQEYIYKLEINIDKSKDFLDKMKSDLYELQEKRDSAWSDNFRDRVGEWISDKESKISEVESQIEDMREKIQDIRSRL